MEREVRRLRRVISGGERVVWEGLVRRCGEGWPVRERRISWSIFGFVVFVGLGGVRLGLVGGGIGGGGGRRRVWGGG